MGFEVRSWGIEIRGWRVKMHGWVSKCVAGVRNRSKMGAVVRNHKWDACEWGSKTHVGRCKRVVVGVNR